MRASGLGWLLAWAGVLAAACPQGHAFRVSVPSPPSVSSAVRRIRCGGGGSLIAGCPDRSPVSAQVLAEHPPKKPALSNFAQRSITGVILAVVATLWVSSSNPMFAVGFLSVSLIGQREFCSIVRAKGVEPAVPVCYATTVLAFATAALMPSCHELSVPLSSAALMLWLLLTSDHSPSIAELSSSLLGMFYAGYLPSFWVRLHALAPVGNAVFRRLSWLPRHESWTYGALLMWWTWLAIGCADVGAYLTGRACGRHKLGAVCAAAGAASPNKTIEGALGGTCACVAAALCGAYLLRWPRWRLTGALYGLTLSVLSLAGDLTASMLKRDAKIKDSGSLLPGHGGVLDRLDSYMFTAPVALFFCRDVLPLVSTGL